MEKRRSMDENRVYGSARNFGGKIQEEAGAAVGDTTEQIKGKINQAAGTAQNLYGQTADATRDTATSLDKWFRQTIETQPYATAVVALGLGWLLGRMHRPY
jgi:uncharacterized protein YjbJ (UPF0337 family)